MRNRSGPMWATFILAMALVMALTMNMPAIAASFDVGTVSIANDSTNIGEITATPRAPEWTKTLTFAGGNAPALEFTSVWSGHYDAELDIVAWNEYLMIAPDGEREPTTDITWTDAGAGYSQATAQRADTLNPAPVVLMV